MILTIITSKAFKKRITYTFSTQQRNTIKGFSVLLRYYLFKIVYPFVKTTDEFLKLFYEF